MLPHASMSSGRRGVVALDRMGVASAGSGVGHGGTDEHGWGGGGGEEEEKWTCCWVIRGGTVVVGQLVLNNEVRRWGLALLGCYRLGVRLVSP